MLNYSQHVCFSQLKMLAILNLFFLVHSNIKQINTLWIMGMRLLHVRKGNYTCRKREG